MLGDLLIEKDGEFIFNGFYMEAYIPNSWFKKKLAEEIGNIINVYGIFNLRCFDKNNNPLKLETMNIAAYIDIFPDETDNEVLSLMQGLESESYRICKFNNGSKFTHSTVQQDNINTEKFLDLLCHNGLPHTIKYSQISELFDSNLQINNVNLNVPSTIIEITIAEICRDISNPQQKFSKVIGKNPSVSEYKYRLANMREICARNSVFAALTYEDMDYMITNSLNMTSYKKEQTESPIEKIIKY